MRIMVLVTRYHGVHGEVVVLSLQLHSVLVASAYLCVALQEHFLVVADPVKHLHTHTFTTNYSMSHVLHHCELCQGTNGNHLL